MKRKKKYFSVQVLFFIAIHTSIIHTCELALHRLEAIRNSLTSSSQCNKVWGWKLKHFQSMSEMMFIFISSNLLSKRRLLILKIHFPACLFRFMAMIKFIKVLALQGKSPRRVKLVLHGHNNDDNFYWDCCVRCARMAGSKLSQRLHCYRSKWTDN